MADYGFWAKNGSNEIQIDSTYRNFSLRYKGVAVANLNAQVPDLKFAQVVLPANNGMMAFRCAAPCVLASVYPSGSNYVYNFLVYSQGSTGYSVYWYLFDEPNYGIPYTGPYGMRIKNSSGVITHDSRMDYMKFSGVISGTLSSMPITNSGNPNYAYYTFPGTLPAVVMGVTCSSQEEVVVGISNPEYMQFYIWQFFGQVGTSIGTTMWAEVYGPYSQPTNTIAIQRENWSMTVIDVAKYG